MWIHSVIEIFNAHLTTLNSNSCNTLFFFVICVQTRMFSFLSDSDEMGVKVEEVRLLKVEEVRLVKVGEVRLVEVS